MAASILNHLPSFNNHLNSFKQTAQSVFQIHYLERTTASNNSQSHKSSLQLRCCTNPLKPNSVNILKTCKNCKTQFDPSLNNPRACRYHTAHFAGETKRKFESVYSGGTMGTPDSGQVFQYWHCCGSEDPFDPGCTAAPHSSYDD
ncbi:carboxypeptidase [Thalictrum thalictroides]|uniref:Carboxypeptidase n=1 Tax=Thalictrum thalictroides TaxID=46969 RepID=A0A7J6XBQ1_THATH|nr:carboxypeptidase [Thalictrum thalictroides]